MNSLSKKIFSLIFTLLFAAGTAGTSPTVRGAAESVQTGAGAAMPRSVIPGGKSIGVILSTDGVTVASVAEFETEDGRTVSPAKEAGIAAGDFITELNGQRLKSVAELNKTVEKSEKVKMLHAAMPERKRARKVPMRKQSCASFFSPSAV